MKSYALTELEFGISPFHKGLIAMLAKIQFKAKYVRKPIKCLPSRPFYNDEFLCDLSPTLGGVFSVINRRRKVRTISRWFRKGFLGDLLGVLQTYIFQKILTVWLDQYLFQICVQKFFWETFTPPGRVPASLLWLLFETIRPFICFSSSS